MTTQRRTSSRQGVRGWASASTNMGIRDALQKDTYILKPGPACGLLFALPCGIPNLPTH